MIDIRLKTFISVAENLSFSKAAQEIFISQPAVSKHISELEKIYNVVLFDRMGNRIRLTEAGNLLLEHARKILDDYNRLEYEMCALLDNTKGTLRIGASSTVAQYILPEIIAKFRQRYSDVKITLLSGNSLEIEKELLQGHIDVGLVECVSRNAGLKYTPFMKDELVAVVRTGNPLASKESITVEELKSIPLVLREFGSGTLEVAQQVLALKGVNIKDLNVEMNIGSTEGIKNYVQHSDAMGIVSIRSVSGEVYRNIFKIVDIDGVRIDREFSIVEKMGETVGLVSTFKDFITSVQTV